MVRVWCQVLGSGTWRSTRALDSRSTAIGLGPRRDDLGAVQGGEPGVFPRGMRVSIAWERWRHADAGLEHDDVVLPGEKAVGEGENLGVVGDGDFTEGRGLDRHTAVLLDQVGHRSRHAGLEGRHADAGKGGRGGSAHRKSGSYFIHYHLYYNFNLTCARSCGVLR